MENVLIRHLVNEETYNIVVGYIYDFPANVNFRITA